MVRIHYGRKQQGWGLELKGQEDSPWVARRAPVRKNAPVLWGLPPARGGLVPPFISVAVGDLRPRRHGAPRQTPRQKTARRAGSWIPAASHTHLPAFSTGLGPPVGLTNARGQGGSGGAGGRAGSIPPLPHSTPATAPSGSGNTTSSFCPDRRGVLCVHPNS